MTEPNSHCPARNHANLRFIANNDETEGAPDAPLDDNAEVKAAELIHQNHENALEGLPVDARTDVQQVFGIASLLFGNLYKKFKALHQDMGSLSRYELDERTKRIEAEHKNAALLKQLEEAKKEILELHKKTEAEQNKNKILFERNEELESRYHSLIEETTRDNLTGLYNASIVDERIQTMHANARAGRKSCAILFIDLDGFKFINDTLGHASGDECLRAAAKVLRNSVREGDTVCRKGGDEFLVLLEEVKLRETIAIVQRIFKNSLTPTEILLPAKLGDASKTSIPNPVFSIGVFYCDKEAAAKYSPNDIVKIADIAQAGAKGRLNTITTNLPLSWDNTLPADRGRGTPAGKYGHAAVAMPIRDDNQTENTIFITGIPNMQNREDIKMSVSERLMKFICLQPVRENSRRQVILQTQKAQP
ncbi:MAG: diguanylate cyclase [Bdellovibrionales bacterium]